VVPQGLVVLFPIVLGGDFRRPFLVFSWVVFGTFLFGILWVKFVGTLRGFLGCDSPTKSVSKGGSILGFSEF
jgi:hypothetical protein